MRISAEEYTRQEMTAGRLTYRHIVELVEHFQDSYGLAVDGRPGPETRKKLDKVIFKGFDALSPDPFLLCPMPVLAGGRVAVITSGFHSVNPSRPDHNGCDWFYEWKTGDLPNFIGDKGCAGKKPNGEPKWVVPYGTNAIAACGGVVQIAGNSPTGYRLWIDHENGWRTGYFHLASLRRSVGDRVVAGDELGLIGDSPRGSDGRHLHFELSPTDRYAPVNPEPYLLNGAA